MSAIIRYWLAVLARSQRFLPPLLFYVAGVVVLTANGNGPLATAYGSCAAVLFLAVAWLSAILLALDDPAQRAVTVVNARSAARVLTGAVSAAVLCCLLVLGFGLVFPLVSGNFTVSGPVVLVGAIGQFGAGLTGVAIGLICSRPVTRRPALSLGSAVILAIAAFVARWASPLNELLRLMSSDRSPARMLAPVTALAVLGAGLLAVVGIGVQFVAVRRD